MRINPDKHLKPPKYTRRNKIEVETEKHKETKIDVRVRINAEIVRKMDSMKSYGDRASTIERALELLFQKHMETELLMRKWVEGGIRQ